MDFTTFPINNGNYSEAEQAVRKAAEAHFEATPIKDGETERSRRDQARRYASEQVDGWFQTQPEGCSVTVWHNDDHDEIRDLYFGGSITVYGPRREPDWDASRSAEKQVYKIVPGHINASSWTAGNSGSGNTVWFTTRELKHRMRMMAMAVANLNKRNQLCLEWERIESPFDLAEEALRTRERNELARQAEQTRLATLKVAILTSLRDSNGGATVKQLATRTNATVKEVQGALNTLGSEVKRTGENFRLATGVNRI